MRLLLVHGADPLMTNDVGMRPLMVAAGVALHSPGEDTRTHEDALEAVKLAFSVDPDVSYADERGHTALHGAARRGLEETVTVTGESPVVDVQNVRRQTVLSSELLDTLPTGRTVGGFIALTLGVSGLSHPVQDVGGSASDTFLGFGMHGSSTGDTRTMLGGMNMNYSNTLAR